MADAKFPPELRITLPKEPVDGYVVEGWRVDPQTVTICRVKNVYHVNTPWKTFSPDRMSHGKDIVDDWMVHSVYLRDGKNVDFVPSCENCQSRVGEWATMEVRINNLFENLYPTFEAAQYFAMKRCEHHRDQALREAREWQLELETHAGPIPAYLTHAFHQLCASIAKFCGTDAAPASSYSHEVAAWLTLKNQRFPTHEDFSAELAEAPPRLTTQMWLEAALTAQQGGE